MIAALLAACSSPALEPALVIVIGDMASPGAVPGAAAVWSTSDQPAQAHRHILTATYAGERPNTLPQVLSLYGHRTAFFVGPGFLSADRWILETADHVAQTGGCLSEAVAASAAWRRETEGPHVVILHDQGSPCPPMAEALGAFSGDTLWVVGAGSTGGPGQQPAALAAPMATPVSPTTLDILPTLLAARAATIPSDARGMDLRTPTARSAIFFQGADTVAIRTARHVLTASVGEAGLKATDLHDTSGTPLPLGDTAAAPLLEALQAWHSSLSANTARERLGQEVFQRILQDGGYWEAGSGSED